MTRLILYVIFLFLCSCLNPDSTEPPLIQKLREKIATSNMSKDDVTKIFSANQINFNYLEGQRLPSFIRTAKEKIKVTPDVCGILRGTVKGGDNFSDPVFNFFITIDCLDKAKNIYTHAIYRGV